jgi:hypothetical protein
MRVSRTVLIASLAFALALASATVAFGYGFRPGAGGYGGPGRGRIVAPYKVTKPSVPAEHVVMSVSFETTGLVKPPIAADDASTTVAIQVYGFGQRMRPVLLQTVPAALSPSPDTSATVYEAPITLPKAGAYFMVAVVSKDGVMVSRSARRPVFAMLPYKISKIRVASSRVATDTSFDATMVVTPAIPGDSSAIVTVHAYRCGARGRASEVASVTAAPTGPVGAGTGYLATFSFSTPGKYTLVAVLTQGGVVVGKSQAREVRMFGAPVPAPVSAGRRSYRHR